MFRVYSQYEKFLADDHQQTSVDFYKKLFMD